METSKGQSTITHLDRTHLSAAISILADAFNNDPMMNYLFAPSISSYSRSLHEMFRFSCEVRLLLGWPLLGCWNSQNQLVGVAGLSLPGDADWPPSLQQVYRELQTCIGEKSSGLMETYSRLADTNRPKEPHYQLGMIGIDSKQQGHGYGGELIKVLHGMSEDDPFSTGVWLDTENPRNVPWYQKYGYQNLNDEIR
ncbi:MAG: GNAT family N-acetyltransferase [Deltaproteobacteria bacterium]|nr:GNAT family N-acetyltransferase [Deltaproteobacteria bacterium]